jgi:type I restriction-modification system DNA methylase subunit
MTNNSELGKKIVGAIRRVLRRCEEVGERIDFPGEGGERRFRGWLASELLEGVLEWPNENVIIGERFDVLLVSDEDHALATIETKTPYHTASKQERRDFEERLSGFPTLRTAYFTNGPDWDRLDIVVSGAELHVVERSSFDINKHSPEYAENFFAPLRYKSAKDFPVEQAYKVNRDNPFISGVLSRLTVDLNETVADFTALYRQIFYGLREGRAGSQAEEVAVAVYSQWCGKSLRVTPEKVIETLRRVYDEEGFTQKSVTAVLTDFGLDGDSTSQIVEAIMSLATSRKKDSEVLRECLWPAFGPSIDQLCAQTAHVVLARTLLYRVGEDEGAFPRELSGPRLHKELEKPSQSITGRKYPATNLLEKVRIDMQNFLPTVYLRGEFDWWAVLPEKRAVLKTTEVAWLHQFDDEMERLNKLMLRRLSHYHFQSIDVDIWRNIYENYLPSDERQRLGGFYTPDELVNLLLDLDGYITEKPDLCKLSYIDPACGSGAFVTTALGRLLGHLDLDLPCHADLSEKGVPAWKAAEKRLKVIGSLVHGIDLHPFASFLTTLNVLFMVLPLYAKARAKDPDFTAELRIFSADSLERPAKDTGEQMTMFTQMNSRIQLSADSYERYRGIMDLKFNRIFGNPPWGGVLKGSLSPVYDTAKKKHFSQAYRHAAQGKYDVYGLFMERSVQLLHKGGRFALITQGTYLDKEWAKGLRHLLATETRLLDIVDLNPFGQLFFNAMNSPCLTVAEKTESAVDGDCLCVVSASPKDFRELKTQQRREKVVDTVRGVLDGLTNKKRRKILFASGARVSLEELRNTAKDRWDLSGGEGKEEFSEDWFTAADLLEMRQGVTPGGCLEVFLMDKKKAKLLNLEDDLVRKAIKSKQLKRWCIEWQDRVLFYPYRRVGKKAEPAFTIPWDEIEDSKLKDRLTQIGIEDALDFDIDIDSREREIVRETGVNDDSVKRLLKHRVSLGIIKYPMAAAYLIENYDLLEGRVFKKKNIRKFNRRWYEYLWPRDANVMLAKLRILSPTLIRQVRFVLDDLGYLSDHACLMIQPTKKTKQAWEAFEQRMNNGRGTALTKKELLQYCLAFLNSTYAQERLVTGHRPTPKGSYAITEAYMKEIPIPVPTSKTKVNKIIELVVSLEQKDVTMSASDEAATNEEKLHALVDELLVTGVVSD